MKKLTIKEIDLILKKKMRDSEDHCINLTNAKIWLKEAGDNRAKRTIGDQIMEWYNQNKPNYIRSTEEEFPKEIKRSDNRETYFTFRIIKNNKRIENIDKLIDQNRFDDAKKIIENISNYSAYEVKELFKYIDENPDKKRLEIYLAVSKVINHYFEQLPIYEYEDVISKLDGMITFFDIFSNYEKLLTLYDVQNKNDYELTLNLNDKMKSEKLRLKLSQNQKKIAKEDIQLNYTLDLKKEILEIFSKCNKSTQVFNYFIIDIVNLINYFKDFLKVSKSINKKLINEHNLTSKNLTERRDKLVRYYDIKKMIFAIYSTNNLNTLFMDNIAIYDYEKHKIIMNNTPEVTDEIIDIFNKIIKMA